MLKSEFLDILVSMPKVFGKKFGQQKVCGSINLKLFRIFPTTYLKIRPQTVNKVSTILIYL